MKIEFKTVVDVRSHSEYMSGHVRGSVNIPLHEIQQRLEEVKQLQQPLILCCASGGRSGQAAAFLTQLGIACENGGSWFNVEPASSSSN